MSLPRNILDWIWWPITITILAVIGSVNGWPPHVISPTIIAILVAGILTALHSTRRHKMELSLSRMRQMAGYFNRRFMGDSSLSIFAIINSLFAIENAKIWDWARSCEMSKRIFNTWCDSFISRIESDLRSSRPETHLYTYLNELWLINSHYYEFIEQFHEIAEKMELPPETREQYSRLVMEYNAFVQEFREAVSEMKKITRTEIEPPSVRFAPELSAPR